MQMRGLILAVLPGGFLPGSILVCKLGISGVAGWGKRLLGLEDLADFV